MLDCFRTGWISCFLLYISTSLVGIWCNTEIFAIFILLGLNVSGHYVCLAACLQCHLDSACTSLVPIRLVLTSVGVMVLCFLAAIA
jgi:hypothetical protein